MLVTDWCSTRGKSLRTCHQGEAVESILSSFTDAHGLSAIVS